MLPLVEGQLEGTRQDSGGKSMEVHNGLAAAGKTMLAACTLLAGFITVTPAHA